MLLHYFLRAFLILALVALAISYAADEQGQVLGEHRTSLIFGALVLAALVITVDSMISRKSLQALGGVFFGLFACGGISWHLSAFYAALTAATLLAVVVPKQRAWPVLGRIGVVVGVIAMFRLSQALAAPFYPAPPESWSQFSHMFVSALKHGPC